MSKKSAKVLVLGSRGLVGSAILNELRTQGYANLVHPVREELNLLDQASVEKYFSSEIPDTVFMASGL